MLSSVFFLSVHVCLLHFVFASALTHIQARQKELDRITKYELIEFDLSSFETEKIIRFEAFDQHYVIQLRLNENVSPNINHQTHDKLVTHSSAPFQCHYHGSVLSPANVTTHHDQSVVALSMCDGRGIRGMVRALGETMYIYPANYYLNASSLAPNRYSLHEQHLIYRWSDYDDDDTYGDEDKSVGIPPLSSMHTNSEVETHSSRRRRRLIYNNGNNVVELYTLADEAFVDEFKRYYGNDWFLELYHYISEAVSLASAEYEAGDWNKYAHVGTLTLKWVELDIAESLSGIYRSLAYSGSYSGKTGRSGYLRLFSDWSTNNKDTSLFDVGMAYSRVSSVLGGGTAWVGGLCLEGYKYGVTASDGPMDRQRKMLAHEVGHNLGLSHDQSYGCPDGDIMGTGDYNTGWSDCSYQYLRDFFTTNVDRITCLSSRINTYTSNIDFPTSSPTSPPSIAPTAITASPTSTPTLNEKSSAVTAHNSAPTAAVATPTISPTSMKSVATDTVATPAVTQGLLLEAMDADDCVKVASIRGLKGKWMASGMVNQRPAYEQNGLYLYMIADDDDLDAGNDYDMHDAALYWVVSGSKGARVWTNGWCNVADIDIMGCSSQWYQGNGVRVKNSRFMSCSAKDADIAPCLDTTRAAYGDSVCVHVGGAADNDEDELMAFTLTSDDGCMNAYGIFEYVVAPKAMGKTTGEIDDDEYFLHLSEFGEWVISADDVSGYGAYMCSELNLYDCIEGQWSQWITDDDAEVLVTVRNMSIAQCSPPPVVDFALQQIEAHSTIAVLHSQYTMPIIVSLLAIAVLTLCGFVCCRRCRNKRRVSFDHIGQSEYDDPMPNIWIETGSIQCTA